MMMHLVLTLRKLDLKDKENPVNLEAKMRKEWEALMKALRMMKRVMKVMISLNFQVKQR
jgi:hypothetical protein